MPRNASARTTFSLTPQRRWHWQVRPRAFRTRRPDKGLCPLPDSGRTGESEGVLRRAEGIARAKLGLGMRIGHVRAHVSRPEFNSNWLIANPLGLGISSDLPIQRELQMSKIRRVALYVRVSTSEQTTG